MIYDVYGNAIGGGGGSDSLFWSGNGRLNAQKIAKQLTALRWTTTASGMPNASDSNTIASGTTVTGAPYSSASVEDGYIGISISLYTFLSAVHNPRSVLYTTPSKGYTGYAYYGTICTSLVCAAWGLPMLITTAAFPKCDFIREVEYPQVELGDMLLGNGHALMVSEVRRDSTGAPTHVRTSESKYNTCVENSLNTYSTFVSTYQSVYKIYRFSDIENVCAYIPSPAVPMMGEDAGELQFPDVMTCFGDKVTRKYGTDVVINVLDDTGYSTITVYRNGVQVSTHNVEDFTLTAPETGCYEVRMTGSGKSSSTFFDIVDCAASISGSTLTFQSTYGAFAIGGYPAYTKNAAGKATTWNNPKRVHFLTISERAGGYADITEMQNDAECNGGIRIYCRGAYGSVSFEVPFD